MHDRDYLGLIRETAGRATALDPDTFTSPETYDVARLAAGAVLAGVDHVLGRAAAARGRWRWSGRPAITPSATARWASACSTTSPSPPRTRAQRVCREWPSSTTTSITATARSGRSTTIRRCCSSRRISTRSIRAPERPATPARARALGFTVNFPMEAGATDADFERIYGVAGRHPSAVSAGAHPAVGRVRRARGRSARRHARDARAQFGRLTALIAAVADECCDGRLVAVTEGGYDLAALAGSLRAAIDVLDGRPRSRTCLAPRGDTPPRRRHARRRTAASRQVLDDIIDR